MQHVVMTDVDQNLYLYTFMSNTKISKLGVAQGSIIRPLQFLIQINGRKREALGNYFVLFPDDISIY